MSKSKETPLTRQYNQIKAKYPGALLLFRVGDFYETFGEDAIRASKILGIVLTKRNNGGANEELAGFPHHSLDNYLPKLVRAGERVAICDQLEDPSQAKGIVKRGVTELVTPGVSLNDNVLEHKQNNYLCSIQYDSPSPFGIAFLDISTGEFLVTEGDSSYLEKMLQSFVPAEVIANKKFKRELSDHLDEGLNTYYLEDWVFHQEHASNLLTNQFKTSTLKGFGVENLTNGIIAAGAILQYLKDTEHHHIQHIHTLQRMEEERYVWLDKFTIRNLELIEPQHSGAVPLLDILDQSITPMGSRLLRKWMVLPLKEKPEIEERLNTVEVLVKQQDKLENLQGILKPIGDLERLVSKIAVRRINPREMVQLRRSLEQLEPLQTLLDSLSVDFKEFRKYSGLIQDCTAIIQRISRELKDNAPITSNAGEIIQDGVHEELDQLRKIAFSGKDYLLDLQQRESERTGIPSLKIAYNKVFGYYLSVSNAHKDKVPAEWIRKQTLVNAERYITEELKEYEDKILNAESKIFEIEYQLFQELILAASEYVTPIQNNAKLIATLDVLASFATSAILYKYAKPEIRSDKVLDIKDGRHPVIERQLPLGESYVPNDLYLDDTSQQIIIITGPNMAGKSALLRQTALIVLMAQMGSFIPAKSGTIGIVDKVFTRVGASDNLSKGESTFMVEMTETASILNNLSDKSLIIMDEIGRGTSTYDGVSIAWSIAEYLHNHPKHKARTLFATHYHELNQLTTDLPRIKNFNVAVKELESKIVFLRKLKPGGSQHSFGIHVAQLAGMPVPILLRADEILRHLEKDNLREKNAQKMKEAPKASMQLSFFDNPDPRFEKVKKELENMDPNILSPIQALLKLNELKNLFN